MADTATTDPSPGRRKKAGAFESGVALGFVATAVVLSLLIEPRGWFADSIGLPPEGWLVQVALMTSLAALMTILIWLRHALTARLPGLPGVVSYMLVGGLFGFALGFLSEGIIWSRLWPFAANGLFVRGPDTLEIAALGLGGGFLVLGLLCLAAFAPSAVEDGGVTRREQAQLAVTIPVLFGEGALFLLITAARLMDWSDPGLVHGVILFAAGAAFLSAAAFTLGAFGKLDELERLVALRHTTASFLVSFFLLAGWALAEAVGAAPALSAYGAFLLVNAVYLAISVPWGVWENRQEIAESLRDA